EAGKVAAYSVAFVDGGAPLLTALVIVSPFFLANAGLLVVETAFAAAFVLAGLALFGLGAFLGKISNENKISYGIKMLLAGAFAAGVSLLLLR
ncbi:MAG: VIT1/CCC1 transporter family protein, partial [Candidatus Micrarchaeota archaeon]